MSSQPGTAIVTGGSAGIGASICRSLLSQGYQVLNLSRRPYPDKHPDLHDIAVDLSDIEATQTVADGIARDFSVTTLIHNAGVIRPALIESVTLADVQHVSNIHLQAGILLLQAVLPTMKAARFGRVVFVGSRAMLGLATRTAYAATKAGQVGMVRTWAMELGIHGVTVNLVAPGPVVTDMFTDVIPEDSNQAERLAKSLPVKRLGQPDDVARAVLFFASPDNGFITGQTLMVCGGASLGSLSL